MDTFDNFINDWLKPKSVGVGIGTVFLSFFSGKLAPKLPPQAYELLDNTIVRMIATSYLLNQQIQRPSLSVIIAIIMVLSFKLVVKAVAPDTPPLSEIVKSTTGANEDTKSPTQSKPCNCFCGQNIYVSEHDVGKPLSKQTHDMHQAPLNDYKNLQTYY